MTNLRVGLAISDQEDPAGRLEISYPLPSCALSWWPVE